jgi:hypothetical protein
VIFNRDDARGHTVELIHSQGRKPGQNVDVLRRKITLKCCWLLLGFEAWEGQKIKIKFLA